MSRRYGPGDFVRGAAVDADIYEEWLNSYPDCGQSTAVEQFCLDRLSLDDIESAHPERGHLNYIAGRLGVHEDQRFLFFSILRIAVLLGRRDERLNIS